MKGYLAKALRIAATVVEVFATAAGVFVSIVQTRDASLGVYVVGGSVATLAATVAGITFWSFQGEAIAENDDQEFIRTVDKKYRWPKWLQRLEQRLIKCFESEEREPLLKNRVDLMPRNSEPCVSPYTKSFILRILYLLGDTTIESFNRFLFLLLFSMDIIRIPGGGFVCLFVLASVISTLFRATNALYSGTREIDAACFKGHYKDVTPEDSCYNKILKKLANHPVAVKALGVAGCAEHTLSHLTGVLLIVKPPYLFITSVAPKSKYFLLPIGGFSAGLLLPLTFAQTWLFDFGETQENINGVKKPLAIPAGLAKMLYATMPIMPIVHGIQTAVMILALSQIIDPITPIVLATVGGIISVLGNTFSEEREAQNQLAPLVFAEAMQADEAERMQLGRVN